MENHKDMHCSDCAHYIRDLCAIDLERYNPEHKICKFFIEKIEEDEKDEIDIKEVRKSLVDNAISLYNNYVREVIEVRDGFLYSIKILKIKYEPTNSKELFTEMFKLINEKMKEKQKKEEKKDGKSEVL